MKTVNGCKDVSICLCKMKSEDRHVYSFRLLLFSCFIKENRMHGQNKNKQIINKADETLTDYRFLSRYHYT